MFRRWILPSIAWIFYEILSFSWRKKFIEHPEARALLNARSPVVFALWHGDELGLLQMVRPYRMATMVSISRDGDIMDFVFRRLGGATSRGSTSRQSLSALRGLLRLVSKGYVGTIAVDGPRGPFHEIKPGIFEASRLCQAHIIPLGIAVSSGYVFKRSWNKACLPYPFSRVTVVLGQPLPPVSKTTSPKDGELNGSLHAALDDAHYQAAKTIADAKGQC